MPPPLNCGGSDEPDDSDGFELAGRFDVDGRGHAGLWQERQQRTAHREARRLVHGRGDRRGDGQTAHHLRDLDGLGHEHGEGQGRRDGRCTLGPLPAWNDYGVVIEQRSASARSARTTRASRRRRRAAHRYQPTYTPPTPRRRSTSTRRCFRRRWRRRPCRSRCSRWAIPPRTRPRARSACSRPASPGSMGQTGVQGQIWANDTISTRAPSARLHQRYFNVPGAMLTYGVTYTVNVYSVDGFQPSTAVSMFKLASTAARRRLQPLRWRRWCWWRIPRPLSRAHGVD